MLQCLQHATAPDASQHISEQLRTLLLPMLKGCAGLSMLGCWAAGLLGCRAAGLQGCRAEHARAEHAASIPRAGLVTM